ncbi:PAAR domain-containing protein [Erwinia amylovora]
MQNAARIGDASSHGGAVCSGSGNVFINDIPAAIVGVSIVTCSLLHGAAPLASGSETVFINDEPAGRLGDTTGCGGVIVSGSANVFIG